MIKIEQSSWFILKKKNSFKAHYNCNYLTLSVNPRVTEIGTVSGNCVGSLGIPRKTASP